MIMSLSVLNQFYSGVHTLINIYLFNFLIQNIEFMEKLVSSSKFIDPLIHLTSFTCNCIHIGTRSNKKFTLYVLINVTLYLEKK